MGKRTSGTPINADKLRKEIAKRGMTLTAASEEIGRASNFLSHTLSSGLIGKDTIVILDKLYNIPIDAYKAEEPKTVTAEITTEARQEKTAIDYNELYKVVYSAMYNATKKILSEGQIEGVLYKSVYEAVKKAWAE